MQISPYAIPKVPSTNWAAKPIATNIPKSNDSMDQPAHFAHSGTTGIVTLNSGGEIDPNVTIAGSSRINYDQATAAIVHHESGSRIEPVLSASSHGQARSDGEFARSDLVAKAGGLQAVLRCRANECTWVH